MQFPWIFAVAVLVMCALVFIGCRRNPASGRETHDIIKEITVDRNAAAAGESLAVHFDGYALTVKLPKEIQSGTTLLLREAANPTGRERKGFGDVHLRVWVGDDMIGCQRIPSLPKDETGDIHQDITVDRQAAERGDDLEVDVGDRTIKLKLLKDTPPGTILRARGYGNPVHEGGEKGTLFLRVLIGNELIGCRRIPTRPQPD